jgi:hypothetical protein
MCPCKQSISGPFNRNADDKECARLFVGGPEGQDLPSCVNRHDNISEGMCRYLKEEAIRRAARRSCLEEHDTETPDSLHVSRA